MNEYISKLNDEQIKPVLDTEGAVLVLAGAGSGKTRVLTSRIAYLIKDMGISPYSILAITFTNKAAKEMRERIEAIVQCDYMWVSTIHSMCTRILRSDIDKLGYTGNFTIFAEEEKKRVVKRIIDEREWDADKLLKQAMWLISDAKNNNISPKNAENYYAHIDGADIMSEIYGAYQDELARMNSLDFDDLLIYVYKLFSQHPAVLDKYAERFKYVHIDEFQDTNEIQFQIVSMLCSKHGNIFAVGDDDQSIYGWRGAKIDNILNFNGHFPAAKIYKLERNYRSTKSILDAANRIIKHNSMRMDKQLWTDKEEGAKVEYYAAMDELQESYNVVSKINSYVAGGEYAYSDFAVLMRMNALSRVFEQEFLKYNIPYRLFGGFKFYERKEIKDAIAYMRILVNPYDDEAILRVINVPKRGIGQSAVEALSSYAKHSGASLFTAVMNIESSNLSGAVINKIKAFKEVLADLLAKVGTTELDLFADYIVKHSGIYSMYAGTDEELIEKRLNLDEFVASVGEFSKLNENSNLSDFLQSVTLSSDIDSLQDETNAVTLATIHAVKGLEFKVVFVIGLDDGIFPLSRARESLSEMEEERRLMYVAITRAREQLYISRADTRFLYGKRDYTLKSRFIDELELAPKVKKENPFTPASSPRSSGFTPAKTEEKDLSKCVTGQVVRHKAFGEGVIVAVNLSGMPTIDVLFKGIGKKTLAVNIAPIEFI